MTDRNERPPTAKTAKPQQEDEAEGVPTPQQYVEGSLAVLEQSRGETEPYEVDVLGLQFVVHPEVFSPKYFTDNGWFTEQVVRPPYIAGKGTRFLEIGPGVGATTVFAALVGAEVTAIDANAAAVQNTQENAERHGVAGSVHVMEGDVFSPLEPGQTFDTIYWNVPFGFEEEGAGHKRDIFERSVVDPGYAAIRRFVTEAPHRLNPGGHVLIGFSDTIGNVELLQEIVEQAGMTMRKVASMEAVETYPVTMDLYECDADSSLKRSR